MSMPGGSVIGSIVIEEKISSGASGELYLGRQPGLERRVALRKLSRDLLASSGLMQRFRREARLGAQVLHPNLVQVFDLFSYRGDHYLVTEHVDGAELRSVLERAGRVPARIAIRIALEAARGLSELHRRGIVHCDLRPENMLISRWGEIKLTALGQAHEAGEAEPPGVPPATPYAAPELLQGDGIDPQVDVFALGVLLDELLRGTPPAETPRSAVGTRPQLSWLIRRCLREEPARRPDLASVLSTLERWLPRGAGDSRLELATWFWDVRMHGQPAPELAEAEPAPQEKLPRRLPMWTPRLPTWTLRLPNWTPQLPGWMSRLALPAAAATGAILLVSLLVQLGGSSEKDELAPLPEPLPEVAAVKAAEPEPAPIGKPGVLAIVAHPWALVQVDDLPPFLTPRARPIELPPGRHELVFRHPRYGKAHQSIVVQPGAHQVVRHVFTGTSP